MNIAILDVAEIYVHKILYILHVSEQHIRGSPFTAVARLRIPLDSLSLISMGHGEW